MRITLLGCGTSSGVPRIGGDWGECDPYEPRNRRRRVSVLVQSATTSILVDTAPDLREQFLDAGITGINAVIWTHEHADHCHGIDDLRPLYYGRGGPIPGYARPRTRAALQHSFGFAFSGHQGYPPYLSSRVLEDDQMIGDIRVRAVDLPHGQISSAGLRFDNDDQSFIYTTDFHELPAAAARLVSGTDLWVVDAVRRRPHPTHPNLAQTLAWIADLRPEHAILTHMDQTMDYATLRAELPEGVEPGYDGMTVTLA